MLNREFRTGFEYTGKKFGRIFLIKLSLVNFSYENLTKNKLKK